MRRSLDSKVQQSALTTAAACLVAIASLASGACGKGGAGGGDAGSTGLPSGATSVSDLKPAPTITPDKADKSDKSEKPETPTPDIRTGPLSFSPIAKHADKSVVTINTLGEEVEASPFSRRRRSHVLKGLGTGFVVEKDGVVLTNNHVIEGADQITVKLSDEREFQARIVGRDASTDIAVLKIEAKELVPLSLGDSEGIEVGDWVVAIGNPFGLSHTVSAGIISAKGRTREDVPLDPSGYYDFLQTDASINPGNSGGPLLNMKSEVVGINTAIRGGGAQGIGFAIPINMVKLLLPMLMRDGHVTRSALGVRIRDVRELSPDDRAALKLVDDKGAPLVQNGAVIEFVAPGGPADRAGLSPGDVILAFEGTNIERGTQLQWVASTYGVGKQATVRVAREGKRFEVKVTLGQLADPPAKPHGGALPPGFGPPPR